MGVFESGFLKNNKMDSILKYRLDIVGVIVGAIMGYLYYYFIGCASGTCAITSNPINSTLYGAVMGFLFINSIKK